MIKVTREREMILKESLDGMFEGISIYRVGGTLDFEKPVVWGVNWGCKGTVNPEETGEFAENLSKASRIAKALNDMELVFTFEEDKEIKQLIETDRDFAIEHRKHLMGMLAEAIKHEHFFTIGNKFRGWAEEQEEA